jgi:hypothetical protein
LNAVAFIHYGDYEINFGELQSVAKALDYIKQLRFHPPLEGDNHSIAHSMAFSKDLAEMRRDGGGGRSFIKFSDLLRKTKSCKATDPRDMVYSLVGLIDDEKYSIHVDYHLSVEKVIRNATSVLFQTENELHILALCQNPDRNNGLPSWVPNLMDAWKSKPFDKKMGGFLRDRGTKNAEIEGEVLKVQGVLWQTLDQICETVVPKNATTEQLEAVFAAWKGFIDMIESLKKVYNSDSMDSLTYGLASSNEYHLNYWIKFLSIGQYFPDERAWVPPELKYLQQRFEPLDTKSIRSCLVGPNFNYEPKENAELLEYLYDYGIGRCLGVSEDGYVGLFPASAKVGDTIAMIRGAPMPVLLRKANDSVDYLLVDEVHMVRIYGDHKGKRMDLDMPVEPIQII